jgi:tetratricopeptide (TPR) repeat protein
MIRSAPDSWRTHALLGQLLLDKESYDAAGEQFRAALGANPRAPGLYRALGDILMAKDPNGTGSREQARALYEKELEIDPRDAATLRRLADISILNENDAEAEKFLAGALAADPHSAATLLSLCKHSSRSGKDEETLGWCGKAAAADPDDAQAHYRLARLFQKLGREKEASQEIETFRVLDARKRTESLYMSGAQIGAGQPN